MELTRKRITEKYHACCYMFGRSIITLSVPNSLVLAFSKIPQHGTVSFVFVLYNKIVKIEESRFILRRLQNYDIMRNTVTYTSWNYRFLAFLSPSTPSLHMYDIYISFTHSLFFLIHRFHILRNIREYFAGINKALYLYFRFYFKTLATMAGFQTESCIIQF